MGQRFRISTIMIQIAAALVVAACTGAQPNKDSVNSLRTLAKSEELPENAPASKIAIAAASTDVRLSQAIANDPELLTQLQKVEEIAASIPQPMATSLIELWLQTDSLNANNAANYLEVLVEILAAIKSQPGTLALESHLDSDVDCKAKLEDELKNYRSKRTSDIIGRLIQQLTACVESAPVQLRHDASVISGMLRTASLNMHPSAVDFSDAKALRSLPLMSNKNQSSNAAKLKQKLACLLEHVLLHFFQLLFQCLAGKWLDYVVGNA